MFELGYAVFALLICQALTTSVIKVDFKDIVMKVENVNISIFYYLLCKASVHAGMLMFALKNPKIVIMEFFISLFIEHQFHNKKISIYKYHIGLVIAKIVYIGLLYKKLV